MRILKVFCLLFSMISGNEIKEEKEDKRGALDFLTNLNCRMMPGYFYSSNICHDKIFDICQKLRMGICLLEQKF